jgi:hypothetical protein
MAEKTERLQVRITPLEKYALTLIAKERGITVPETVRAMIREEAQRGRVWEEARGLVLNSVSS